MYSLRTVIPKCLVCGKTLYCRNRKNQKYCKKCNRMMQGMNRKNKTFEQIREVILTKRGIKKR